MKTLNFWRTLFFSALAVTAFAACSDDDKTDKGYTGEAKISVNGQSETSVAHDLTQGFTDVVKVVSNGPWTMERLTADASWCTPNVWAGQGGTTDLKFEVGATDKDRECTFKLTAPGQIMGINAPRYATIVVKQNAGGSTDVETNVADIRTKMAAIATEAGVKITEDLTLTGIVVSDVASGGFAGNRNCALVDNSTDQGAGILVRFPAYTFPVGQVITGSIKDATTKLNFGVLQIEITDASKFTAVAGSIVEVEPIVSTVADLPKYESQLVRVNEVQPVEAARGGNFFQGTDKYTTTNFETKTGVTFPISIYNTNTWAKTTAVPAKSGYVCGLVSIFNGAGQVAPRNASDVAGLDQDLFTISSDKTTIANITAAGSYEVANATIVAMSAKSVVITDASNAYMPVYIGATTDYAIGDKLASVKGTVALNGEGPLQFSSPEIVKDGTATFTAPTAAKFAAAEVLAWMAAPMTKYVEVKGKLVASGNYYNLEIDGVGGDVAICKGGSIDNPTAAQKAALDPYNGLVITVKGYTVSTYSKWFTVLLTDVVPPTGPYVTIATTPTKFPAAGSTQDISFATGNIPSGSAVYATIEGTDAAQFSVPAGAITGGKVTVTANPNEAEVEKNATLKIYIAASEGGAVQASDVVDLSQMQKAAAGENTIEIDLAAQGWTNAQEISSLTVAPLSFAFAGGGNTNVPKYYTSGAALRLYAKNTMTISGATITKIVFTYGSRDEFTASAGTLSGTTWTGSSNNLVFTVPDKNSADKPGQGHISKMTITYKE